MAENPDEAYPIILKTLNPDTASNLTVDDLKSQIPDTTYFPTAEEAQELTFNDDTEMSWKKLTDYQFEQAEALGTDLSGITSDEFIVQDEIFDEFMADDKLQDYVNADF